MKILKYLYGNPIEEWGSQWKDRLLPSARSKVLQKWNASGKKPKPESSNEYTKRRIKEETKRTWRSDVADTLHGIGEGVLALHPYTAIPYYGAKVGQDILNGNINWSTALNASIPLFHLSPQAVGLREATNVALEDAANAGSKTARNWRVAREINLATKSKPKYTRVPSKNLFRTLVYKGGEITDPYSNFVTTDPLYAANYGKVTPYIFESRSIAKAREPMMGYRDPVSYDMFIYNNTKRNPNATAIIGHDAVTGEFTPSKGIEILNMNPKNLYPVKTSEPSTSLKFFERKPSKINKAGKLGNIKTSTITDKNAASMTPEQWTAAQDAAIARGDMAEAQRLRDLHFKVNAPEADVPDMYHGTDYENIGNYINIGNVFRDGLNPNINFYTTPSKQYARRYGSNIYKFKVNANTKDLKEGRFAYLPERRVEELKAAGYKGTVDYESGPMLGAGSDAYEYTFFNPKQYKLADAVTYDNGVRIPLGKRDNFKLNDIRYGLLPFGIGLTGYGLYKRKLGGKMNTLQFLKNGSGIYIKKKNRGSFTRWCGGNVTEECIRRGKVSSNPKIRKKATFADNARHFKHKDGGKAFINGVSILDSNPKAYKYVKKKYRMAQEGAKLNFWQKTGNFLNSGLGQTLVNGITGVIKTTAENKNVDAQAKAAQALNEAEWTLMMNQIVKQNLEENNRNYMLWVSAYLNGLIQDLPSLIVAAHIGLEKLNQDLAAGKQNLKNKNNQISSAAKAAKSENWANTFGNIVQQGMGTIGLLIGNNNSGTTNYKTNFGTSDYKLQLPEIWTNPTLFDKK